MGSKAAVFVRRTGASGAGHVGWAFEYSDGTFNVGAVENTQGYPLDSPKDMAFWAVKTSQIVAPMKILNYDEFKVITIQQPNPDYAWQMVQSVGNHWYSFAKYNCMNSTYDVLRAFGVKDLPPPNLNWVPNAWFDKIVGDHYKVHLVKIPFSATTMETLAIPLSKYTSPPAWRVPKTPEFKELENSLTTKK